MDFATSKTTAAKRWIFKGHGAYSRIKEPKAKKRYEMTQQNNSPNTTEEIEMKRIFTNDSCCRKVTAKKDFVGESNQLKPCKKDVQSSNCEEGEPSGNMNLEKTSGLAPNDVACLQRAESKPVKSKVNDVISNLNPCSKTIKINEPATNNRIVKEEQSLTVKKEKITSDTKVPFPEFASNPSLTCKPNHGSKEAARKLDYYLSEKETVNADLQTFTEPITGSTSSKVSGPIRSDNHKSRTYENVLKNNFENNFVKDATTSGDALKSGSSPSLSSNPYRVCNHAAVRLGYHIMEEEYGNGDAFSELSTITEPTIGSTNSKVFSLMPDNNHQNMLEGKFENHFIKDVTTSSDAFSSGPTPSLTSNPYRACNHAAIRLGYHLMEEEYGSGDAFTALSTITKPIFESTNSKVSSLMSANNNENMLKGNFENDFAKDTTNLNDSFQSGSSPSLTSNSYRVCNHAAVRLGYNIMEEEYGNGDAFTALSTIAKPIIESTNSKVFSQMSANNHENILKGNFENDFVKDATTSSDAFNSGPTPSLTRNPYRACNHSAIRLGYHLMEEEYAKADTFTELPVATESTTTSTNSKVSSLMLSDNPKNKNDENMLNGKFENDFVKDTTTSSEAFSSRPTPSLTRNPYQACNHAAIRFGYHLMEEDCITTAGYTELPVVTESTTSTNSKVSSLNFDGSHASKTSINPTESTFEIDSKKVETIPSDTQDCFDIFDMLESSNSGSVMNNSFDLDDYCSLEKSVVDSDDSYSSATNSVNSDDCCCVVSNGIDLESGRIMLSNGGELDDKYLKDSTMSLPNSTVIHLLSALAAEREMFTDWFRAKGIHTAEDAREWAVDVEVVLFGFLFVKSTLDPNVYVRNMHGEVQVVVCFANSLTTLTTTNHVRKKVRRFIEKCSLAKHLGSFPSSSIDSSFSSSSSLTIDIAKLLIQLEDDCREQKLGVTRSVQNLHEANPTWSTYVASQRDTICHANRIKSFSNRKKPLRFQWAFMRRVVDRMRKFHCHSKVFFYTPR